MRLTEQERHDCELFAPIVVGENTGMSGRVGAAALRLDAYAGELEAERDRLKRENAALLARVKEDAANRCDECGTKLNLNGCPMLRAREGK
jgi:hypothetical protein